MARPKLNEIEKKEKKLTVRFRAGEMQELQQQADACGLSLSEFARRRILNRRVTAATDLKTISELRRLGGLIKHLFNESGRQFDHRTWALLDELRAAAVRVGKEKDDGR